MAKAKEKTVAVRQQTNVNAEPEVVATYPRTEDGLKAARNHALRVPHGTVADSKDPATVDPNANDTGDSPIPEQPVAEPVTEPAATTSETPADKPAAKPAAKKR